MSNKAEKFVKRILDEEYGVYIKNGLSYDREQASIDIYWAINKHLGQPNHWPPEYSAAYKNVCQNIFHMN